MYSLILGAVVGLLVGVYLWSRMERKHFEAVIFPTVIGIVVGLFGALFLSFASPRVWVHYDPVELTALRTVDGTSGVFVWGTGSVGNSTTYRVMIKDPDGSFRPFAAVVQNNNTRIIEDESLTNSGTLKESRYVDDPNWWLGKWSLREDRAYQIFYEYRVPKGTVRNQFNLE